STNVTGSSVSPTSRSPVSSAGTTNNQYDDPYNRKGKSTASSTTASTVGSDYLSAMDSSSMGSTLSTASSVAPSKVASKTSSKQPPQSNQITGSNSKTRTGSRSKGSVVGGSSPTGTGNSGVKPSG